MADNGMKSMVLDMDALRGGRGPTMGQVLDAARRIEAGLDVSDEDRAAVARFQTAAKAAMDAIASRHAESLVGARNLVSMSNSRQINDLAAIPSTD